MSTRFRRDPPQLSTEESELADRVVELAGELHDSIDMAPSSPAREQALARLQECVMWALKAIGDHR